MKIALNHTRFGEGGGVEAYLRKLVSYLLEKGHELHFYGRKVSEEASVSERREGSSLPFVFHRVPCIPFPQSLRILSFAYFSLRMIKAESYDLTIGLGRTFGHDLHRDSSGCFKPFKEALGSQIKRSFLYTAFVLHIEKKLYTSQDLIHTFCVSKFVRDQILSRYAISPKKISVIYNGVDASVFKSKRKPQDKKNVRSSLGLPEDRQAVLFVGNDWRRKGLEFLIRAVSDLPNWDLWVLGSDRKGKQLFQLAKKPSLQNRLRFFGRRPSAPFYAASDVFALPSLFDPLSNAAIEAMAAGLPVILSPKDGASELVVHGKSGFVLPSPTDTKSIASYLRVLEDSAKREEMGAQAKKISENLTWERHFQELEKVIERVTQLKASKKAQA